MLYRDQDQAREESLPEYAGFLASPHNQELSAAVHSVFDAGRATSLTAAETTTIIRRGGVGAIITIITRKTENLQQRRLLEAAGRSAVYGRFAELSGAG